VVRDSFSELQTLEEGFVADSSWGWLGRIAASSQVRDVTRARLHRDCSQALGLHMSSGNTRAMGAMNVFSVDVWRH